MATRDTSPASATPANSVTLNITFLLISTHTKLHTEVTRTAHSIASNEGATPKCTLPLPLHNIHHGECRSLRPRMQQHRNEILVVVKRRRHGSTRAFMHHFTPKPAWCAGTSSRTVSKGKSSVREKSGRLTAKVVTRNSRMRLSSMSRPTMLELRTNKNRKLCSPMLRRT
jgi:hypothetical protein